MVSSVLQEKCIQSVSILRRKGKNRNRTKRIMSQSQAHMLN